MRKLLLISVIVIAGLMGVNPADFDPYHDNDHETWPRIVSVFAAQQERQPCWGSDQRCPDGKYRDGYGKEQPDTCNNDPENPHKCACHNATDPADGESCPMHPGDRSQEHDQTCQVYCRGQHCHCTNYCDD